MKVNVASAQGPLNDIRTWSGTAKNLTDALNTINALEQCFEANTNSWLYKSLKKLLAKTYGSFGKNKNLGILSWKWLRNLSAESVRSFTDKSPSKHTLHLGTTSLPFLYTPTNQSHYLYTDGTWNLWSKYSSDQSTYSSKEIRAIDKLEKLAYHQVKHIFSISEYVKSNLIDHYNIPGHKITVVGTGTGIIKPFYGQKDYHNGKILFAAKGRFDDKGGQLVLKAFDIALTQNPNLNLTIVGQNEYTGVIDHPQIKTFGFISIDELQDIFNTHSLFLMPALNEPWGLVYIEAMLCRMPIMGLNRNSFPELSGYGEFGIGIDEPDPILLAQRMVDMMADPELMTSIGNKAQQSAVEKYNWNTTAGMIIDVINKDIGL
jgi:glycosyltransferase involved in cell wall biosynthesis